MTQVPIVKIVKVVNLDQMCQEPHARVVPRANFRISWVQSPCWCVKAVLQVPTLPLVLHNSRILVVIVVLANFQQQKVQQVKERANIVPMEHFLLLLELP